MTETATKAAPAQHSPTEPKKHLTVEQKLDDRGLPKPVELIEIKQAYDLTLQDHRIFNRLLEYAWPTIMTERIWSCPLSYVRGSHKGGQRVKDSLARLRDCKIQVVYKNDKGQRRVIEANLLGGTDRPLDETDPTSPVYWSFDSVLLPILHNSTIWGRIKPAVTYAMTSKYALRLYEWVALRANMERNLQDVEPDALREMFGLAPLVTEADGTVTGEYKNFPQFNQSVLRVAMDEVNGLSDFNVLIEPLRKGGRPRGEIVKYRLTWWAKTPEEIDRAAEESARPKAGRRERLAGIVETILPPPLRVAAPEPEEKQIGFDLADGSGPPNLDYDVLQRGYDVAAKATGVRIDKSAIYHDWRDMVVKLPKRPSNPAAHFIDYCKRRAAEMR